MPFILLGLGLVLLVAGAEFFVRGASGVSARFGVPPLIIGLTVVAFGTSAPELAVSVTAVLGGTGDIALGNVVGSNIANILLIGGLSALITPLAVTIPIIRMDVPVMIAVSALGLFLMVDGVLSSLDGLILATSLIAYVLWLIRRARHEEQHPEIEVSPGGTIPRYILTLVVGLSGLVLGSRFFVSGASTIARLLGVSELLIGLTVVAVGTSLPELATSLVAAIRGQRDIAIGNVIGSNVFNLLGVVYLVDRSGRRSQSL